MLREVACSVMLCSEKVPLKMAAKFYETVARPTAMAYGFERFSLNKKNVIQMVGVEMRMQVSIEGASAYRNALCD